MPVQTFRVQDFSAYFRFVRARLEETAQQEPDAIAAANYPEPVEHCDVCRWWSVCDKRRRADDHLSLVAGISRLQSRELQAAGVATLAQLGTLPLPLQFTPRRGATETYSACANKRGFSSRVGPRRPCSRAASDHARPRIRSVAGAVARRRLPRPRRRSVRAGRRARVPLRSGDRGADGTTTSRAFWACSDVEERVGVRSRGRRDPRSWEANPGMHVYHYAPTSPPRSSG